MLMNEFFHVNMVHLNEIYILILYLFFLTLLNFSLLQVTVKGVYSSLQLIIFPFILGLVQT